MSNSNSGGSYECGCFNLIPSLLCAMIGYHLNVGIYCFIFAVLDFIFWPIVVCKWIIYHQLNLSLLHQVFPWFFQ